MSKTLESQRILLCGLLKNGNKHGSEKIFKNIHKTAQKQTKKQTKALLKVALLKTAKPFKQLREDRKVTTKSQTQPTFLKTYRERLLNAWKDLIVSNDSDKAKTFSESIATRLRKTATSETRNINSLVNNKTALKYRWH